MTGAIPTSFKRVPVHVAAHMGALGRALIKHAVFIAIGSNLRQSISDNGALTGLQFVDRFQFARREVFGKIPKADPIRVAHAIVAIAQNTNPRLRYLVGRDAKMQLAMKRILPWKFYEKLVANYLKLDQD